MKEIRERVGMNTRGVLHERIEKNAGVWISGGNVMVIKYS
jgi:hypothetical protein